MRTIATLLLLFVLSSCAAVLTTVEYDDTYVWNRQQVPPLPYRPRNYNPTYDDMSYFYMRPWYRPWYSNPYWNQPTTVVIVPKQENSYQYGKRPNRESMPNNRNLTSPRRGRD